MFTKNNGIWTKIKQFLSACPLVNVSVQHQCHSMVCIRLQNLRSKHPSKSNPKTATATNSGALSSCLWLNFILFISRIWWSDELKISGYFSKKTLGECHETRLPRKLVDYFRFILKLDYTLAYLYEIIFHIQFITALF